MDEKKQNELANGVKAPAHILIVEDDIDLAQWMRDYLQTKGYQVSVTGCGNEAVMLITELVPDVVILDGMLPNLDGLDVCKAVRPEFCNAIIMVTARDEEIDEVLGLEMGADDYLTKPVRARALLARIRKHVERQMQLKSQSYQQGKGTLEQQLNFNQLTIDREAMKVTLADKIIKISSNEFEVLWLLASKAGEIVSRHQLVSELRGFDYDGFDRSIDLKVSRLRKKLGDNPTEPNLIKTIWGKGYLFAKDAW
ncbi:response regulator transcription factor [Thalassotalea atypica]|uniref:response regulator transcription factor n=1 Tax=Thalassotalea atypica TaxID=2054316 RepID=UPI0025730690|nr:response regulator transcription factor [Thalassotalea atypica]